VGRGRAKFSCAGCPRLHRAVEAWYHPPLHEGPAAGGSHGRLCPSRPQDLCPPAPAPIVTSSITSPRGYPRLLASARREPIEPAQWPPSPTIRGDAGFSLDARRGRDRITYISYLND